MLLNMEMLLETGPAWVTHRAEAEMAAVEPMVEQLDSSGAGFRYSYGSPLFNYGNGGPEAGGTGAVGGTAPTSSVSNCKWWFRRRHRVRGGRCTRCGDRTRSSRGATTSPAASSGTWLGWRGDVCRQDALQGAQAVSRHSQPRLPLLWVQPCHGLKHHNSRA